jgi:hypothetical protein
LKVTASFLYQWKEFLIFSSIFAVFSKASTVTPFAYWFLFVSCYFCYCYCTCYSWKLKSQYWTYLCDTCLNNFGLSKRRNLGFCSLVVVRGVFEKPKSHLLFLCSFNTSFRTFVCLTFVKCCYLYELLVYIIKIEICLCTIYFLLVLLSHWFG